MYHIACRLLKSLHINSENDFLTEVSKLSKPYIPISSKEYQILLDGDSDYYLLEDGQVVTFGPADGGLALMPLNKEAADTIMRNALCAYL